MFDFGPYTGFDGVGLSGCARHWLAFGLLAVDVVVQPPAIGVDDGRHGSSADNVEASVNTDMGFMAETPEWRRGEGVSSSWRRCLPPILSVQRASVSFCA